MCVGSHDGCLWLAWRWTGNETPAWAPSVCIGTAFLFAQANLTLAVADLLTLAGK